jgi:signal transduction histidine kinase
MLAGIGLTTFYRRSAERGFDERLSVYIKELVADLAAPPEAERQAIGDLGEPRFDLPLSGWYWQIIRLDGERPTIRTSRSLVGGQLPKLLDQPIQPNTRGLRESYVSGPDDRSLRILEREIDVGEDGRFTVAVAAPSDEIDGDIRDFRFALTMTFVLLGLALVASTLIQVRFGLRPLVRLGAAVGAVRTGEAPRIAGQYPPDLAPAGRRTQPAHRRQPRNPRTRPHSGRQSRPRPEDAAQRHAERGRRRGRPMPDRSRRRPRHARPGSVLSRPSQGRGAVGRARRRHRDRAVAGRADPDLHQDLAGRGIAGSHDVPAGLRFRGEKQDFEEMLGNLLDNAFKWAESTVKVSSEPQDDAAMERIALDRR